MAPNNPLSIWGNEKTMNLNTLILTNIQSSPYFKVNLYELKTYHEVIDEIYYKVSHLEPWEKGSRKTAGQTGMCGGVRGVGAGGIVSSAFCLLYKLFTLRLTKKQVNGLISHQDSPYIRALGFMYIRFTQPPQELWDWFEPYLDDEEEIDVKAGGGHSMTIGEMLRHWLTKLEWYSTLFPRIPVPTQKDLDEKMKARAFSMNQMNDTTSKAPGLSTAEEVVAEVDEDWHNVEQPVESNSKSARSPERRRYDRPRDKLPSSSSSSHQMSPLSKVGDKNRTSHSPHGKSPRSRSPHSRRSSPHRKSPSSSSHKYSSSQQQQLSSMDDFAVELARERERQRRERERERNGRHKDHHQQQQPQQQQQQQQQQSHHHHHRHHHHHHRHHSSKSKDSQKVSSNSSPLKGAGMVPSVPKERRASSRSPSPALAARSHSKKKKHSRKSHCKDRKRSKSPSDTKEQKRAKRSTQSRSHSRSRSTMEDNGHHSNSNNNNTGDGDDGKSRSHHKKEHSSSERGREKKAKKKKHSKSKSKENGEYYA
ncbi:pre-mRNA-splicing factor 38B isoform X1 [Octopus sinensis]|uniref:Pre-mRNA-splicing factor 38 n=2 Tax=Octopus sinensis TaxID=2607531 RepID=A0A6P7TIX9_9MOLL|nr:pre-mRNA-splicing factor 38B isoform X1 [Octopus sinensis]XP_029649072.1 pre-mRNA-splicing factor 38B isoform X1 [Octopus sinensis]XP_036367875.1 pre-mRNA-splicing factor 38B isoform X1 [Octopus sinensis]